MFLSTSAFISGLEKQNLKSRKPRLKDHSSKAMWTRYKHTYMWQALQYEMAVMVHMYDFVVPTLISFGSQTAGSYLRSVCLLTL